MLPDIVQTQENTQTTSKTNLKVVAAGTMLYDHIWLGSYMSGGVGFIQYATAAYTDNVLDDFTYYGKKYVEDKFGLTTPSWMWVQKLTSTHWNSSKNTQHYSKPYLVDHREHS